MPEFGLYSKIEDLDKLEKSWRRLQAEAPLYDPNGDFDHYLTVLQSKKETLSPFVVSIECDGQIEGLLVGRLDREKIVSSIGYKKIFGLELVCLNIIYGGVLLSSGFNEYKELLDFVRNKCKTKGIDIINFNMVDAESQLYKYIISYYKWPAREIFGLRQKHFRIEFRESFKDYFLSLSKNTRKNIKKYSNRFEKEFQGRYRIQKFFDGNIEELIDYCSKVHNKTYKKGLGVGLEDVELTIKRFKLAEKKGWNHSRVLFIDDEPAAYQIGYLYKEGFFGMGKGFDPKYSQFRIGNYHFFKMLEDLFNLETVKFVDFGFGDAEYKEIFGNSHWDEINVSIYPKNFKNMWIILLRTWISILDRTGRLVVKKLDIEKRIKKLWRVKLSQDKSDD